VWNKGVASRGKMMGKSYEEKLGAPQASAGPVHVERQLQVARRDHQYANADQENEEMEEIVHWSLIDPLVKDLNQHSRYYIYHFATQICEDLVIYDGPGQNPIRDLIPATTAYPSLLQIILANSAFHVFNITRDPGGQSPYQKDQKPCLMAYYQGVSRFGGPMKTSYADALLAKQQALSLLAQSVASVNPSNVDLVLVVILLFINYALIESGQDKWKVHMDGARKLITLIGTPPYIQQPMSGLRLAILADFLVYVLNRALPIPS
jgi:hypothetical protein